MKSATKILLATIVLLNIAILFLGYSLIDDEPIQIRTVNLERVFNDFEMTKELDEKYELSTANSNKAIDSLTLKIKHIQSSFSEKQVDSRMVDEIEYLLDEKRKLTEKVATIKSEFEGQIWNRLRLMINEYGEINDHLLIIGNDNEREVLYAKNAIDITEEITSFVNLKYRGR